LKNKINTSNINHYLYLLAPIQQPGLVLQDLLVELRAEQEAAALALRQRAAELSDAALEAARRDSQLEDRKHSGGGGLNTSAWKHLHCEHLYSGRKTRLGREQT